MSTGKRIKLLLQDQLGKQEIKLDDDLALVHGADSLDFVEIKMAIEEEFEIFWGDDLEKLEMTTARDCLKFVETALEKEDR